MPIVTPWSDCLIATEDVQLRQRIAQGTADQTIRGMFFNSATQALAEIVPAPRKLEILSGLGLASDKFAMMKRYPITDFNRLRLAICDEIAKGKPEDYAEAARFIASYSVEAFMSSVPGRVMKLISSNDPERLGHAGPSGYAAIINDGGDRSYEVTGPRSGIFRFRGDSIGPAHSAGVFLYAFSAMCRIDPDIAVVQTSLGDFDLNISW